MFVAIIRAFRAQAAAPPTQGSRLAASSYITSPPAES